MSKSEVKIHAIWSIKKETILNTCIKENGDINSETFKTVLPNVQYFFCFQFVDDEFLIYVDINTTDYTEKETKCFIASANIQRFGDPDQIVTIAKREELFKPENNFFVDEILTLEIRAILCLKTPQMNLLNNLWKKDDKDFAFVVNKWTVKAHKFIIRQCSAVFDVAIDSNLNEMKIENFAYETVRSAVALCYDNDHYYSNMTGFEIIKFASTFDMPLIKDKVEHKLNTLINEETVCEFANKSLEYKAEMLLGFCVNFLSECIKNGKSFDGTLENLNSEIKALVFNNLFPQVKIS